MKTLCLIGLMGLFMVGCGDDTRELSAREVQSRYSLAFCTKHVVVCDMSGYEDCLGYLADVGVWTADPRSVTEAEMEGCETDIASAPCDFDIYADLETCDFWSDESPAADE